ncbi:hypothetical protein B0H63DRAFT_447244 [Podospora didyma]|uniref:2EXR domain-containing protein n=1 Tax=Podospora didyma TaxID=330526 RepID=A0AAE0U4W9_9PEZI|nr:hypothetical protein B0H63DRAFT_447244 [Podospora didyma]
MPESQTPNPPSGEPSLPRWHNATARSPSETSIDRHNESCFNRFGSLPGEIRVLIWRHAVGCRVLRVHVNTYLEPTDDPDFPRTVPLLTGTPALKRATQDLVRLSLACREADAEVRRAMPNSFPLYWGGVHTLWIPYNPDRDLVCISYLSPDYKKNCIKGSGGGSSSPLGQLQGTFVGQTIGFDDSLAQDKTSARGLRNVADHLGADSIFLVAPTVTDFCHLESARNIPRRSLPVLRRAHAAHDPGHADL